MVFLTQLFSLVGQAPLGGPTSHQEAHKGSTTMIVCPHEAPLLSLSTGDWTTSAVRGLGSAFPSTHWGNPKQHHHGNKTSASMCPSTNINGTLSPSPGMLESSRSHHSQQSSVLPSTPKK